MSIEKAVKGMLESAGFADVFCRPVSVTAHPECIVVGSAKHERRERFADGERVAAALQVHVCRDAYATARDVAYQVEAALRLAFWEPYSDDEFTINSMDVQMPDYKGRDGSGRHVFAVEAKVTVDRSLA